jgi:O-antigen/teichoic acid export membrane protein
MPAPPDPLPTPTESSTLRRIASRTVSHLAGGPLTSGSRAFLKNFAYLFSSDMIASGLTFFLSAWAVRIMGPAQFGLANLIISAAQLVTIPMLFGMHASTSRAVAASSTPGPIMGSALLLTSLLIPTVATLAAVFHGPLARLTGLSETIVLISLPLAAALVVQTVLQGMLAGLRRFREFSRYNIWSAVVYSGLMAAALLSGVTWVVWLYVVVTGLRSLVLAVFCFVHVRGELGRPSRDAIRTLAHFGGTYTVGSVAYFFALGALDSLMLNAYHGTAAVGLYGAYFAAFNIIASRVIKLVSDVLIPTATAHGEPARIAGRVVRVLMGPGWLIVPGTMVLARFLFLMYGGAYTFSWMTAALLGLCIYLHVGVSLTSDLMLAGGIKGLRVATAVAILTAIVNVIGNVLLIPPFSVDGSLVATAGSSAMGFALRVAYLFRSRPRSSSV